MYLDFNIVYGYLIYNIYIYIKYMFFYIKTQILMIFFRIVPIQILHTVIHRNTFTWDKNGN